MREFGAGRPVPRSEDYRLLQGRGQYTDDLSFPDQCHMVVARSPIAHGIIRSVDVSAARRATGVLAVLTGEDAEADGIGTLHTMVQRHKRDAPRERHAVLRDRKQRSADCDEPSRRQGRQRGGNRRRPGGGRQCRCRCPAALGCPPHRHAADAGADLASDHLSPGNGRGVATHRPRSRIRPRGGSARWRQAECSARCVPAGFH